MDLTPNDFENFRCKIPNAIVLFYLEKCDSCIRIQKVWDKLARVFPNVYRINCTRYFSFRYGLQNESYLLATFPSMVVYFNGYPSVSIGVQENERTFSHLKKEIENYNQKYVGRY